jgi:hypothetical protein
LCGILIEFGIPMKLVKLIKMCRNDMNSRVRVGKNLLDTYLKNEKVTEQHHMKSAYGISSVTNLRLKQRR